MYDKYADLMEAANKQTFKGASDPLLDFEQLAVSVFTVFHMLCMRGVGNMRLEAKYMDDVFRGLHAATGCMVFSTEKVNEQHPDRNRNDKYNDDNRVFVIKAPKGTLLKGDALFEPPGCTLKEVTPQEAIDFAKAWVGKE